MTRITIRLGTLAPHVAAQPNPAEFCRQAIAEKLGVQSPEMSAGNPEIASQAKRGAKARWGKSRKSKK